MNSIVSFSLQEIIRWHYPAEISSAARLYLFPLSLCHLIISCNEKETIEYIEESIKWLKEINVDQPCPSKKSPF